MEIDGLQKTLNDRADAARSRAIYNAFDVLIKALASCRVPYTVGDSVIYRARDAAITCEESRMACRAEAARDFIGKVESLQTQVDELNGIVNN